MPGSVKIRASPRLGGEVVVAHSMLKAFPLEDGWEEDEDDPEEADWEMISEDPEADPEADAQEEPEVEEKTSEEDQEVQIEDMNEGEMQKTGHFMVEKILKDKFCQGGWPFLVQ